ncbi:MAG: hypothetical protein ACOZF2_13365 [Thermodesulfobacteriota bacterium]
MMKRTVLILALVFALALPSAALAKAEFSLGGFIKLDAFWSSTQTGKNMNAPIQRNNNANFHHGRLKFTAQGSRFNFTIKGPKLWGATTTAFIEIDFDPAEEGINSAARSASNSYSLRMRHAMFRLNWPETELLFGQYWSLICEWWPELAQDGPFQMTGIPTARLPQISLTQKFLGAWMATVLIGEPNAVANDRAYNAATTNRNGAECAETPQIQARIRYTQDLWGKAAYQGKATPFVAQIAGGWQRNVTPAQAATAMSSRGQNAYSAVAVSTRQQYVDPWVIMGTLFVPVIPTHSANLAGTASLLTQWWIGQGVEAFGWSGIGSNLYRFAGVDGLTGLNIYDYELQTRFGGYAQAQYYFTNQWYLTFAYAMSKSIANGFNNRSAAATLAGIANGYTTAVAADNADYHHELNLCLWFRPILPIKFGLQYAYQRTNWYQITTVGSTRTNLGDSHRVEFVGLFYF